MANQEYDAIKKIMNHNGLANEMEKVSPGIQAEMTGYLVSSWLPKDVVRKVIMAVITIIAVVGGVFYGYKLLYLPLLILPFFSPRIGGEVAMFFGRIQKK